MPIDNSVNPGSKPTRRPLYRGNVCGMASDILERVKKVTIEELQVKEEEVVESASFIEDLGADSLDVVELVMAFEDEFGIDIPDDEVGEIKTVGNAVDYIGKKLGEGQK